MRYYEIKMTNAKGDPVLPSSLSGLPISSVLADGTTNPAALLVELDLPVYPFATPGGNAFVRVHGLSIKDLSNAFNLSGPNGSPIIAIEIRGGMSKGLPLATSANNRGQAGLLVKGSVLQAFGNWIGTSQSLDLVIGPSVGLTDAPKNFVLNWRAGTTLAAALKNTFDTALPGTPQRIGISSNLVLNHDEIGIYGTIEQLSSMIMGLSKSIIADPAYHGVSVALGDGGQTVVVTDLTTPPKAKAIQFEDLIGQPTWIQFGVIQAKTVMRADISVGDTVTLPQGLQTTSASSFASLRDKTTFSGNYSVISVHHYGNSRQPDAASWNTTFDMTPLPPDAKK